MKLEVLDRWMDNIWDGQSKVQQEDMTVDKEGEFETRNWELIIALRIKL